MTIPANAKLVAVTGVMSGETFALHDGEVTLGRDASNTICVPDPSLSRRHCAVVRTSRGWELQDRGSANGTFVNNVPVATHLLADGDRLSIGDSLLLFVAGVAAIPTSAELLPSGPVAATRQLASDATRYLEPVSGLGASRVEHGLRTLLAMSAAITAAATESDLHRELLRLLHEAPGARAVAIVVTRSDAALDVTAATAMPDGPPAAVNEALVRQAMGQRAAILTDGDGTLPRLLCAPIAAGAAVLGALYLARGAADAAFDDDDLQLVTAIGHLTVAPLENVRRVAALRQEAERLEADLGREYNMVGDSAPMRAAYERIARLARADTTVLVVGETGTGKELAARAIHANSARARRPFVAVNCAALTETLLESELFGHERGAFTGAVAQKKGKLESAEGGSLFLDEIGEMPPAMQSKLLRVLQEREFERVGGTRPIRVDVRIISATNRTLAAEVAAGRFRQDLYFRVNVVSMHMPALRERRADIPHLARHFLSRHARAIGRRVSGFSPEALARLSGYSWPGNVRELENAIQRAMVLGSTREIVPDDLPEEVLQTPPAAAAAVDELDFHAAVVATKKRVIVAAFRRAAGSYVETARLLHVHPNYLHRLVRNLDLKSELETTTGS